MAGHTRLSEDQAAALHRQVLDAARRMSDAQLLDLADALHEARRRRRPQLRTFDPDARSLRDLV